MLGLWTRSSVKMRTAEREKECLSGHGRARMKGQAEEEDAGVGRREVFFKGHLITAVCAALLNALRWPVSSTKPHAPGFAGERLTLD